jgi:uncharacterized protein
MTEVLIPARQGRAVRLPRGAAIDVINTHGTQVVDFWALCWPNTSEHMSMEHTRIALGRLGAAQRPTEVHVQLHCEAQKEAQNDG